MEIANSDTKNRKTEWSTNSLLVKKSFFGQSEFKLARGLDVVRRHTGVKHKSIKTEKREAAPCFQPEVLEKSCIYSGSVFEVGDYFTLHKHKMCSSKKKIERMNNVATPVKKISPGLKLSRNIDTNTSLKIILSINILLF